MSRSNRDQAVDKKEQLLEMISAERLLDYVISNYLSGSEALNAMICAEEEFFPKEEEEEVDGSSWRDSEDFFDEEEEQEEEEGLFEVGNEVEVVNAANCSNEVGDIGIITEIEENGLILRVTVEGRINSGNWMFPSQVVRINY